MRKCSFLLAFLTTVLVATAGCSSFATKEEVAALRGDVNRLATETGGLRQTNDEHRYKISSHAAKIYEHEDKLRVIDNSVTSRTQLLADMDSRVGKIKTNLTATNAAVAEVRRSVDETNAMVAEVKRSVKSVNDRLASLEKRVVGIRRMTEGRLGTLEDANGIDHKIRLLRLSGFAVKSFDLTAVMKKRLDEIVALVKKGEWSITSVVGFADTVPYLDKDKKDLNPELARSRAKAVALYLANELGKSVSFGNHGATAKFGDMDMNRSALVRLERVAPPIPTTAPAPAAPAPTAPPTAPAATPPTPTKKP